MSLFAQIEKTFRTKWKNLKIRFLHIVAEIFPKKQKHLAEILLICKVFFRFNYAFFYPQ